MIWQGWGAKVLSASGQGHPKKFLTLGDVLYAGSKAVLPEEEWASLVRSIAAGDQLALHALYERSHRIVFTLLVRITANRETAEELTIQVFHGIWRRAQDYNASTGTVLGWVMNQAHSKAIDYLRSDSLKKRGQENTVKPDPRDVLELSEQREALGTALKMLTVDERLAIETTFFAGLTHAEAAARLNQPLGIVKTRIRSGLHKLAAVWPKREQVATTPSKISCEHSETTCAYALHALTRDEVAAAVAHNLSCPVCRRELEILRPLIDSFVSWPAGIHRPRASLQVRLARRITDEAARLPELPSPQRWCEPDWQRAAPGIEYKLLATDAERQRVSMLVRFAPDTSYGAHTHAGTEECHLLDGDLQIDERKLLPGDYKCSQPDSRDAFIHSETGCTCLVVTSTEDWFD